MWVTKEKITTQHKSYILIFSEYGSVETFSIQKMHFLNYNTIRFEIFKRLELYSIFKHQKTQKVLPYWLISFFLLKHKV